VSWREAEPTVAHYASLMAKLAPHLGYQDCYQQAALVALEALPRYRRSRGPLRAYVGAVVYRALTAYRWSASTPVRYPHTKLPDQPDVQPVTEDLLTWEPDAEPDPLDVGQVWLVARQVDCTALDWVLGDRPASIPARTARRRQARLVRVVRGRLGM
jgi:DNA-directed RNA polymerase specialized sigma24 family protein